MNYAQIRSMDISNGSEIGVALFVQGCPIHCEGCFNQSTWDFDGGKEWTSEVKNDFLSLINRPYIKRVSILGGEPLATQNLKDVFDLVRTIKKEFFNINVWLYSGYLWESFRFPADHPSFYTETVEEIETRRKIISSCDILVDGPYIHDLRDMSLKYRGSSNQRVIDVQESLKQGQAVNYLI